MSIYTYTKLKIKLENVKKNIFRETSELNIFMALDTKRHR